MLTPIKIEKSQKTPKLPSKVVSFWRAKHARNFGNVFLITVKSKRKTLVPHHGVLYNFQLSKNKVCD